MLMPSKLSNPIWNGAKEKKQSLYSIFALPAGYSGCAFWRYRLPLNKLKKLGSILDINIADNPNKIVRLGEIQEHVQTADLITMQSPGNKDSSFLMQVYKSQGKKVVVDYDDFSFDLSPGNPRYAELGTKEVTKGTEQNGAIPFQWRDMENGFDLKSNIEKYEAFKKCVAQADLIITTTKYLACKFRQYNPNVTVCPNSIDFDLWKPIMKPKIYQDQVRIGWFGGDSHFDDLHVLGQVLPRICKRFPEVVIVLQCPPVPQWQEFFKDIPPNQLDWHNWVDLRHYTLMLAARFIDIGLCPLGDTEFNRCKSSIKFFEFAALGGAVVAQDMLPYVENITHASTGFLAKTEDEWENAIALLIKDIELRRHIAQNGYDYVFKNFNMDVNCRIWESAFLNCIEGKQPCGPDSMLQFQPSQVK